MKLDESTIVITGAARGLGAAMAQQLAQAGARLALIDLQSDLLFQVRDSLPGAGHHAVVASVSDEQQVEAAFAEIEARLGAIDGLVNNAGITRDGLLVKVKDGEVVDRMSLAQWQQVIDVNLTGVFLCGRAAAERMIRGGRKGVIINIASISRDGNFGQTNYSAAKAIAKITSAIPSARLAEPSEIASTIRFIFENDYVNGRDFAIDGGLRL